MSKTDVFSFKVRKPVRFSHHPKPGYVIKSKIWIEKDGELFLRGGRVMLLERIDELGSMAAAAKSMGLGYRYAWLWVDAMNRLAPLPLVEKATGGVGGGYAKLTDEGRKVVADYKELNERFQQIVE